MINLDLSPKKIKRLLIVRNINILKNNLINNNDIELLSDIISIDLNLVEDSEFIAWEKEIITTNGFNNLDSSSINALTRLEKEKDTYKYILETTDAYNDNDISSVRFNGNIKKIRIFNIVDIELTGGKKELNDRTINGEIDITMPMYTKQKWTLKIKRDKSIEKDLDIKYGVELREQLLSLITQMERDSKLDDLGI
jgi:hypothetical protein